jgi:hypothetical protein
LGKRWPGVISKVVGLGILIWVLVLFWLQASATLILTPALSVGLGFGIIAALYLIVEYFSEDDDDGPKGPGGGHRNRRGNLEPVPVRVRKDEHPYIRRRR